MHRASTPQKRSSLLKTARPFCDVPQRRRKGAVVSNHLRQHLVASLLQLVLRARSWPSEKLSSRAKRGTCFLILNESPQLSCPSKQSPFTSHKSPSIIRHHPHDLPIRVNLHK